MTGLLTEDELRKMSNEHVPHIDGWGSVFCEAQLWDGCPQDEDWPCRTRRLIDDYRQTKESELAQVQLHKDRQYYIRVQIPGKPPMQVRSGDTVDIATTSGDHFWIRFGAKPVSLASDAEVVTKLLRAIAGFERTAALDSMVMLRVLKRIVDPNWVDDAAPGD